MTHTVDRDNDRPLEFEGEQIAMEFGPERNGRHTELTLWRTTDGRYVAAQVGHSKRLGERTRRKARVCDTPDDVFAFLRFGWLAKRLYDQAGLSYAEKL